MRPEEQLERAIEPGDVVAVVHEQASQRGGGIGAAADVDPFERADGVEQASVMHVEPGTAQHAPEQQHVGGQVHEPAPRASARLSIACIALAADRLDVFLVLEQDAERFLDGLGVELVAIERHERRRPVERLGDAGRLVELGRPQLLDERGHLVRQALRDAGQPGRDDAPLVLARSDSRSSSRRSGASARRALHASGSR